MVGYLQIQGSRESRYRNQRLFKNQLKQIFSFVSKRSELKFENFEFDHFDFEHFYFGHFNFPNLIMINCLCVITLTIINLILIFLKSFNSYPTHSVQNG